MSRLERCKITGVCPAARAAVLAHLLRERPAPVWLVVADEARVAEQLAEDILFFHALPGGAPPLEARTFPEALSDSRDMREAFLAFDGDAGQSVAILTVPSWTSTTFPLISTACAVPGQEAAASPRPDSKTARYLMAGYSGVATISRLTGFSLR